MSEVNFKDSVTLFSLAQRSLTIALLTFKSSNSEASATLQRLEACRGRELDYLIAALPHSGLNIDLLKFLELKYPSLKSHLEKYWLEICCQEFPKAQPSPNESWINFYERQRISNSSRIKEFGMRLRDSYKDEEKKIHQLQTIAAPPNRLRSRGRPSSLLANPISIKRTELMQKSRQEAMSLNSRYSKSIAPASNDNKKLKKT